MIWLKIIIASSLVTLVVTYLATDFLDEYFPPAERIMLYFKNVSENKLQRSKDSFRVVLCWLENDKDGHNTKVVASAFTTVRGFTLVRSASIVKAFGTADDWEKAIQKRVDAILEDWDADLALVGTVKKRGEVLSLWFVPSKGKGDGTLARGSEHPYVLENVTLDEAFHSDLSSQLAAMAFAAVAPLVDSEYEELGQVLEEGLREAINKLRFFAVGAQISPTRSACRVTVGVRQCPSNLGRT